MILSIVHPTGILMIASELMTIELADKVLSSTTAEGTARVNIADEHPLLLVGAAYLKFHQVRALPYTVVASQFCHLACSLVYREAE